MTEEEYNKWHKTVWTVRNFLKESIADAKDLDSELLTFLTKCYEETYGTTKVDSVEKTN